MDAVSDSDPKLGFNELVEHQVIRAKERRHFILLDVLPLVGAAVAIWVLSRMELTYRDWVIFLLSSFLTSLGVEVGYHRFFTHRAFDAPVGMVKLLGILGSFGGQGPVISWVSTHRHHHKFSDRPEDSHSPQGFGSGVQGRLRGLFHAHILWKWGYPYPNPVKYSPDTLRDAAVLFVNRHYYTWVVLGLVGPGVIGGLWSQSWDGALSGFLLAGVVRLSFSQHVTWAVNSLCHVFGTKTLKSRDHSGNFAPLALPTLGVAWHNNHHAFPSSATNWIEWWHVDLGYLIIRGFEKCGLASNLNIPTPALIAEKRIRPPNAAELSSPISER